MVFTILDADQDREKIINDRIDHFLETDYSPFIFVNFREFLQNMPDSEIEILLECASDCNKSYEAHKFEFFGRTVFLAAKKYWEISAAIQAEKEIL